jgi:hypothetical protein
MGRVSLSRFRLRLDDDDDDDDDDIVDDGTVEKHSPALLNH